MKNGYVIGKINPIFRQIHKLMFYNGTSPNNGTPMTCRTPPLLGLADYFTEYDCFCGSIKDSEGLVQNLNQPCWFCGYTNSWLWRIIIGVWCTTTVVIFQRWACFGPLGFCWTQTYIHIYLYTGWWFGTCFICPYIGNNNPN